jgi:trimeric autotransporter adhesin
VTGLGRSLRIKERSKFDNASLQEKQMNTNTTARREGSSPRTAMVAMFVLVAGLLFGLMTGRAHAAPPAGTVIGNQATASYVDAGLTPRTATSNLVQTTVSQVRSFTLDAPGARTASAGQTVYYPHTITNTGNGTDTYTLNTPVVTGGSFTHATPVYYIDADGNGVPDNFTPITTSGPIALNGIFRFVLAGTVPGSATNGQTGTMTASVSDTTPTTLTNLDTTTVANSAIAVTKALSITSGPSPNAGPITVTLSYTNTGSAAATNVELRDLINPALGFTYIAGSGRWSVTGATVLTDAGAADNQSGIVYDFNVTAANRVNATIASVPAGFSGTLTFQVSVNAGVAPGFISNTAQYLTSTQAVTNTNTATYQVLQTASVVANGSTTSSVNGTLEPVTIASAAPGSTISFTNVIWNLGNAADTFVISMAGQGSWPVGSNFTLFQSDGITSLIANTTPSIPMYAAGCAAGFETDVANQRCGYRVILRVQLPVVASGGPYSITKTATSSFNTLVSETVVDTLTAIGTNSVDLTNNTARTDSTPAGTAAIGNQATTGFGVTGATVITTNTVTPSTTGPTITRFQLYVNNTSAINDSFNLTSSAAPAGWTIAFRADGGATNCSTVGAVLTSTGTINAGGNRLICAEVTVPVASSGQAAVGNYDLDFTATSALNGAVADVKRDRVTVNAVNSVTVTPNNTQQTFPGGSVTYGHSVANLGNVAETISFAAGFLADSRSAQGWTSVAYLDVGVVGVFEPGVDDVAGNLVSTSTTFALGVNASRTIWVRVFAPGSAVGADPPNVTTLTARYNAGASSASATDNTSVTDGLVLLKEQVAVSCAAAGPHAGYSTAPIASGPATAPGMCIAYRITGTNTTAANITSVVINDNIPANTRQRNSCGAPATVPGTISSPGDGLTGTVSATVGPLTPSQSAIVTFCVRIDP